MYGKMYVGGVDGGSAITAVPPETGVVPVAVDPVLLAQPAVTKAHAAAAAPTARILLRSLNLNLSCLCGDVPMTAAPRHWEPARADVVVPQARSNNHDLLPPERRNKKALATAECVLLPTYGPGLPRCAASSRSPGIVTDQLCACYRVVIACGGVVRYLT